MAGAPKGHSGGGRPPNTPEIDIDAGKVYSLAATGCTVVEIAKIIGCSTDTIHRRFQDIIDRGRNETLSKIRAVLLEEGLQNRNPMILKHLADRYLGSIDSPMVELKVDQAAPKLTIEFIDPHAPKGVDPNQPIDAEFKEVEEEDEE